MLRGKMIEIKDFQWIRIKFQIIFKYSIRSVDSGHFEFNKIVILKRELPRLRNGSVKKITHSKMSKHWVHTSPCVYARIATDIALPYKDVIDIQLNCENKINSENCFCVQKSLPWQACCYLSHENETRRAWINILLESYSSKIKLTHKLEQISGINKTLRWFTSEI